MAIAPTSAKKPLNRPSLAELEAWTPLAARGPHLELHIWWMQEIRRFEPSTVSRRFSATAGFCRTCAIDGLLEHSPAEYVRRQRGAGCRLCHQPVGRLHNLNI
jgi:hypothetical protein